MDPSDSLKGQNYHHDPLGSIRSHHSMCLSAKTRLAKRVAKTSHITKFLFILIGFFTISVSHQGDSIETRDSMEVKAHQDWPQMRPNEPIKHSVKPSDQWDSTTRFHLSPVRLLASCLSEDQWQSPSRSLRRKLQRNEARRPEWAGHEIQHIEQESTLGYSNSDERSEAKAREWIQADLSFPRREDHSRLWLLQFCSLLASSECSLQYGEIRLHLSALSCSAEFDHLSARWVEHQRNRMGRHEHWAFTEPDILTITFRPPPASLLGYECQIDAQCQLKVPNSRCISGLCSCPSARFVAHRKDKCLPGSKVNEYCLSDSQCRLEDPHSFCKWKIPQVYGLCRCPPNYKSINVTYLDATSMTLVNKTRCSPSK